ncbi:MAG: N-acetyl-gamma-glutamyl-phosphate reductase [Myxococcales bacterium]|nr:N-acetyl-gamma-glutamyl-phosphate reductase [Myxococcales bacterium]
MTTSIAVVGVSGFSGIELVRLAAQRADVAVVSVLSDRWKDVGLGRWIPGLPAALAALVVRPQADALAAAREADVVVLATPAEASADLAPKILGLGRRVLDLSGAFRLTSPDVFREYYRFEHPEPALLAEAHYGLPQLPAAAGDAPRLREARLVANPGCYATAAILPLAPLVAEGLAEPDALFVDGKSGVTGAGRKVAENLLFTEVSENLSPYRVANHQHTPEIELALSRVAKHDVSVTFAPHLAPLRRGLIATTFGRLTERGRSADLDGALRRAYAQASSPFPDPVVEVVAPEEVTVKDVWGRPTARVGARGDSRRGSFVAIGSLDNLLKGAASQAMENLLGMVER